MSSSSSSSSRGLLFFRARCSQSPFLLPVGAKAEPETSLRPPHQQSATNAGAERNQKKQAAFCARHVPKRNGVFLFGVTGEVYPPLHPHTTAGPPSPVDTRDAAPAGQSLTAWVKTASAPAWLASLPTKNVRGPRVTGASDSPCVAVPARPHVIFMFFFSFFHHLPWYCCYPPP